MCFYFLAAGRIKYNNIRRNFDRRVDDKNGNIINADHNPQNKKENPR